MIKQFILNGQFIQLALFLLLLTIIFYGISNSVVKMSFGDSKDKVKLSVNRYLPSIVLVVMAVVFYYSSYAYNFIEEASLWF